MFIRKTLLRSDSQIRRTKQDINHAIYIIDFRIMSILNDIHLLSLNKKIPEFIVKLYNMLQKKQYFKIICWSEDSTQVQIKNCSKLEGIVLPHYFRHGKTESFIRQLNMYGFSKRNHPNFRNSIFFKNQFFRRGDLQSMTKLRRKKRLGSDKSQQNIEPIKGQITSSLKFSFSQLVDEIYKLNDRHPDMLEEMKKIIQLAEKISSSSDSTIPRNYSDHPELQSHQNMFQSIKDASRFHNHDSLCSFGQKAEEDIE